MNHDPKNQITRPVGELNRELRTGINDILGCASLLESHADEKDRDSLQQILRAGRQMLDLLGGNLPEPSNKVEMPQSQPSTEILRNVLYVEDNEANFILVGRILESRPSINLVRAECGQKAVELARELQPQLILLDLNLPDLPGSEVLRQLRANPTTDSIPVVVISADATPSRIERLLSAGARNYLTKPFSMEMLIAVVDEVLTQSTS
jgi:CheY-like chemotaxis protein